MKTTKGLIVALAVLIIGAMTVAACGGDDDANTSATAQATATNQGSQATTATGDDPTTAPTDAADPTDPPSNGGSDVSDACSLLAKEEVEAELGETVNAPEDGETYDITIEGGTAAVSTCGWTSESFASSISLTYWSAPGAGAGIDGMIELACTQKEEISGLGDRACWYDEGHVQIQAAEGEYFIDMFATMSGDASDVLEALMGKAIDRVS